MKNSSSEKTHFIAFCCGLPMKVTREDNRVHFRCANKQHGRWFTISEDPSQQSTCSCHSGQGKLDTGDLGAVRLYSCKACGAKYTVFLNGIKIEANIEGLNADDVAKVGRETISALWDRPGGPGGIHIDISGSAIGILNTGEIEDIQSLSVNIKALTESNNSEIAKALKHLCEAVFSTHEISVEQRTVLLNSLKELSRQASMAPEKREKKGKIRSILTGIATSLGAAGGLAEVWSTWGPVIQKFFGL